MPEAATYSVGSRLSFQDCFRLFPLFNSRLLAALFGGSTSLVCHLLKVGNGSCNHNGVFFFSLPLRRKANSIHSLEPATISLGKASSNVQSCTARSKVWLNILDRRNPQKVYRRFIFISPDEKVSSVIEGEVC